MESGLFITLYDEETLKLYLDRGVYSQHMTPQEGEPSSYSNHYRVLGDYACARENDHVFFFRKRKIYYAGQIVGSGEHGAFYLNGTMSPMGRESDASLVWDESQRDIYQEEEDSGVFRVEERDNPVCQPFLMRFEDGNHLGGTYITSDQLYFELGEYPYPLPSNSISGMGFCTLTPGETNVLLELLENEPEGKIQTDSEEDIELEEEPTQFNPDYGVDNLEETSTESHLEASVIADPSLLPEELQPRRANICRQVPISPFKPNDMDRADLCYFGEEIEDGTIPNMVVELKRHRAGKSAAEQVVRYLRWLHKRLGETARRIEVKVYASGFTRTFSDYIPSDYEDQISLLTF